MITDPFVRTMYFFEGHKPLLCTYEGEPVPKGRPRVVQIKGKPVAFTPKRTQDYEKELGWAIREQLPGLLPDTDHEWGVAAVFFLPTRRKSDTDNLIKAVMDACDGIVFENDSQVTELVAVRSYDKARPRVEMAFFKLNNKADE